MTFCWTLGTFLRDKDLEYIIMTKNGGWLIFCGLRRTHNWRVLNAGFTEHMCIVVNRSHSLTWNFVAFVNTACLKLSWRTFLGFPFHAISFLFQLDRGRKRTKLQCSATSCKPGKAEKPAGHRWKIVNAMKHVRAVINMKNPKTCKWGDKMCRRLHNVL